MKIIALILIFVTSFLYLERGNFSIQNHSPEAAQAQAQAPAQPPAHAHAQAQVQKQAQPSTVPDKQIIFQSRDKYGNLWVHGTPAGIRPPAQPQIAESSSTGMETQKPAKKEKKKKKKRIIKETRTSTATTTRPNAVWFLGSGYYERSSK